MSFSPLVLELLESEGSWEAASALEGTAALSLSEMRAFSSELVEELGCFLIWGTTLMLSGI